MVLRQYLHVCTSYHGKESENKQLKKKKDTKGHEWTQVPPELENHPRCNFIFKRGGIGQTLLSGKAFPSFTREKGFSLLYTRAYFENRTNNTLPSSSSLNHRGEKPSYTRAKSLLEQGREILVRWATEKWWCPQRRWCIPGWFGEGGKYSKETGYFDPKMFHVLSA